MVGQNVAELGKCAKPETPGSGFFSFTIITYYTTTVISITVLVVTSQQYLEAPIISCQEQMLKMSEKLQAGPDFSSCQ